jgi:tetratricopeptide (TPR) repeat protein|tara:strand:- start:2127 stop:4133 length:2007 start_codon:yes stop_codon:yes gene_type:complete
MTQPISSTAADIDRVQRLLGAGKLEDADTLINTVLVDSPENSDGLYTFAVIQRLKKNHLEALEILDKVLQQQPNLARAYQERALNELSLNKPMRAGRALESAVALDPSLLKSWQLLVPLYNASGSSKAGDAQQQVEFLETLPSELLTAISFLSADRLLEAEKVCRSFLMKNKTHIEGMRLLAEIATRNNILEDAEFLLESIIAFEPDHLDANIQYAYILLRRQRFHRAYDQAKKVFDNHPEAKSRTQQVYASACFGVGRSEEAIKQYLEMIESDPSNAQLFVSLGHIHNTQGDPAKAVDAFKQAYTLSPNFGDAYWSLANTKSYKFDDQQVGAMQASEASPEIESLDQIQINFALGKAYEDRRDYAQAFHHYAKGNDLKKPTTHYAAGQLQQRIDSQISVCSSEFLQSKAGMGNDAPDPIFIVGLPRSGSTLLEQILASHSKVDGTMELHNILDLAKRLRGRDSKDEENPRYPQIITELDDSFFERFGAQFIKDTQVYRESAPFFTDKMPNNFFHIGLIKLILPNAKVIDARRHPMACCFSGFKQLFGEGQEFSYGLADIGNYYRQYVKLMDHWDNVLPGFVLRVQHEDVVEDLETQVRRILDFCGLPFEEACLAFHKTERSVRTPSAEQVRQPIYTTGLDQWRNFEEHLQPLIQALGPDVLKRYPIK